MPKVREREGEKEGEEQSTNGYFLFFCIMSLFSLIGLDEEQQTMSVFLEGETGSR